MCERGLKLYVSSAICDHPPRFQQKFESYYFCLGKADGPALLQKDWKNKITKAKIKEEEEEKKELLCRESLFVPV